MDIVIFAPPDIAYPHSLSAFLEYMCRVTVLVPSVVGDLTSEPENSSESMTIQSPILICTLSILQSDNVFRLSSFALKAFLQKSIASAARVITRYGVIEWNSEGT